jgi:hypothetical protein
VPELQRIRPSNDAQLTTALRKRIDELMTRIAEHAQRNGCTRHWVIAPRAARWFQVDIDERFGATKVTSKRFVDEYQAILTQRIE